MAIISEVLTLIDNGIDPGFVASLAGLSLAAAAFYAPTAANIIKENSPELEKAERDYNNRLNASTKQGGMDIRVLRKKVDKVSSLIKGAERAQKSLIKAFLIFVYFVVYSISLDQLISAETSTALFDVFGFSADLAYIPLGVDITLSAVFLWFAGKNLWDGALEIGRYFDVNFEEEQKKISILTKNVAALGGKNEEASGR